MQFRKLNVKALEIGKIYVAYSAKNKLLSKNGNKGVLVKLVESFGNGASIKVQLLGTQTTTNILQLDTRDNAWVYDPSGSDMQVCAKPANKAAFPGFSPRMEREGWEGKPFIFREDELYELTKDDVEEHAGKLTLRHEGDTIDPEEDAPYVNIFLASDIYPVEPPEWRIPRAQRMGVGAVEIALPPKRASAEDEQVIALLSDALTLLKAECGEGKTACYNVTDDKGKVVYRDYHAACHAGLQRTGGKQAAYILTAVKAPRPKEGLTSEILTAFINYLTGYSPFADAFVVKDAEWIRANGYILTANVSAQMVAGACIATRQCWEYPHMIAAWYGLMEQGLDANTAFLFGCRASLNNGKWKFAQAGTGHTVFRIDQMPEKAIINFIDGKPVKQNDKPYSQKTDYYGVNNLWGECTDMAPVVEKLGAIGGGKKAWGAAGVSFDDAMEQAADIIEDWQKAAGV